MIILFSFHLITVNAAAQELVLTNASVTDPIDCFGGTAEVTITATGGTGNIFYTFNGETNTSGIFTGVDRLALCSSRDRLALLNY